eukprot:Clim_evm28s238 gene=Clim_evmTU28s238
MYAVSRNSIRAAATVRVSLRHSRRMQSTIAANATRSARVTQRSNRGLARIARPMVFNSALNHQSYGMRRQFHASASANSKVVPFMLADIGEGIAEAEILTWHVEEGSKVEQFDPICEVQSDKATVEITSRYDGTVVKLHYSVGDMAKVGRPLVDIKTDAEDGEADEPAETEEAEAVETPAAATEASSSSGAGEGTSAKSTGKKALATPAVRRIAIENNIDLADVPASGKDGRVLKEDILKFVESGGKSAADAAAGAAASGTLQTPSGGAAPAAKMAPAVFVAGEDRREPVRGLTRAMIRTMKAAVQVPHFGYCEELEVSKLIETRKNMKAMAEDRGVKLTYMPFFIKAASLALKSYPVLNSQVSEDETEIIYKGSHNIGVAMDTPMGLIVPNIKHVEQRSVFEIAGELNRLQALGKDGKLGADDLKGGTFTLSNIGAVGGTYASPVLAIPEVCIGALGKFQKVPRFDDAGNVIAANIVQVSWSADHRVVDGATIANFTKQFQGYIEEPMAMVLDMK